MWNFLPSGLLMPAAAPMDKADPVFTHDGEFDLQVRGRVTQHLRYFMDTYMEPGTFHDDIEQTPGMDYNCRFYTTREAYADGMRLAILDIDYKKFKPEAERKGRDGKPLYGTADETRTYHSVLNSIWGTLLRLAPAGGWYGPYDAKTNPDGYKPFTSWRYGNKSIGSSFLRDDRDGQATDMDYTPAGDTYAQSLLEEVEGLPEDEWEDYLNDYEIDVINAYRDRQQAETENLDTASYRKAERRSRREEKRRGRQYRRANRQNSR